MSGVPFASGRVGACTTTIAPWAGLRAGRSTPGSYGMPIWSQLISRRSCRWAFIEWLTITSAYRGPLNTSPEPPGPGAASVVPTGVRVHQGAGHTQVVKSPLQLRVVPTDVTQPDEHAWAHARLQDDVAPDIASRCASARSSLVNSTAIRASDDPANNAIRTPNDIAPGAPKAHVAPIIVAVIASPPSSRGHSVPAHERPRIEGSAMAKPPGRRPRRRRAPGV